MVPVNIKKPSKRPGCSMFAVLRHDSKDGAAQPHILPSALFDMLIHSNPTTGCHNLVSKPGCLLQPKVGSTLQANYNNTPMKNR
mmetsp:Transcript_131866/g.239776  ORF Transcript_131866/g.239776 Transcript_131866/m.239776 type:complete len:84 (+) Transcript_131866:1129-1380(+)